MTDGWFVRNALEATWKHRDHQGAWCVFEDDDTPFGDFGFNLHVLEPGQPNGLYHAESTQEGFLVLSGTCLLLVEGQERPLRRWDYVHCPPHTNHIFVGTGEEPCVLVMVGARRPDDTIHYPVDAVAARHGASARADTDDPDVAYAHWGRESTTVPAPPPLGDA